MTAEVEKAVREALESKRITKIRQALSLLNPILEKNKSPRFRLGIARTFTLEAQEDAIRLMLALAVSIPEIHFGELDNIEQTLLDSGGAFQTLDAAVILWRLEDLYPEFVYESGDWSDEKRKEAVESVIDRIQTLCNHYLTLSTVPLFISTFPMPRFIPNALNDLHAFYGLRSAVTRINLEIMNLAHRHSQIHLFDFARWTEESGSTWVDPKMDLYARQPISSDAILSFAAALRETLNPLIHPSKKALALDLDGVLWGGILGESGIENLQIGRDYPGNIFLRIQQTVKKLKEDGILLILLSKNNLADVEEAFAKIPDMILTLNDFAAVRVNWRSKHENLRDVAEELSLGLDSFVFLDDQRFEQEEMAHFLPQVKILPVNDDPLTLLQTLVKTDCFDTYRTGQEDTNRTRDYANQRERKELAQSSSSVEAFLRSLQLHAVVRALDESTLPRAVQMLGKTNQFNLTARRHGESDVRKLMTNPKNILLTLSLKDRFGDQGIIGLLMAVLSDNPKTVHVDTFLLSCRAIGRGAENVLWSEFLSRASEKNYQTITAEFLAGAKNQQVSDLFLRLGMMLIRHDEKERHYRLSLPASFKMPDWINVEAPDEGEMALT